MPRVSVVIATHNRATLLPQAIESARRAGNDVEIIVVDDASTDDTPAVCRGLDGIVYRRLETNLGPAHARNLGIRESSCDYVAFLDDDDSLLPGALDGLVALLEAEPSAGFAYGQVYFESAGTGPPKRKVLPKVCPSGDLYVRFLSGNVLYLNSAVVRKHCILEVGPFDPSAPLMEDWDFWMRLAERYPVISVHRPVATVRAPALLSNHRSSNRVGLARDALLVQKKGLDLPRGRSLPTAVRRKLRRKYLRRVSAGLLFYAAKALFHGGFGLASAFTAEAFRLLRDPESDGEISRQPTTS
jgi:glycosyltransferase involved in cell wall biosynthesis